MRKKVLETAKITHIDKYIHPYSRYWDAYYTIVSEENPDKTISFFLLSNVGTRMLL